MKVAVTGASGFVGTVVCQMLGDMGHEVEPVDLRATAEPSSTAVRAKLREWVPEYTGSGNS